LGSDIDRKEFFRQFPVLEGKRIILFLGRITWKKGFDILSEAFARLSHVYPDAVLVLAGNDESGYVETVRKMLGKKGVTEKVFFTGMLLGREKWQAFAACDVFVLPSYSENFGMSVIEAMAAGAPVVISDQVALAPESKKEDIAVVVETTAASLYNGLHSVLHDPEASRSRALRAKEYVRRQYDIRDIADHMIALYKGIIKK